MLTFVIFLQQLFLLQSILLNNLSLLLLRKNQHELLLTITIPGCFCLMNIIKLVSGFFESWSAKRLPLTIVRLVELAY